VRRPLDRGPVEGCIVRAALAHHVLRELVLLVRGEVFAVTIDRARLQFCKRKNKLKPFKHVIVKMQTDRRIQSSGAGLWAGTRRIGGSSPQ
jgi:hypothetical protein